MRGEKDSACAKKQVLVEGVPHEVFVNRNVRKNGTSSFKGVRKAKNGSWAAEMKWLGSTTRLGHHKSEEAAAVAWKMEYDRLSAMTYTEWKTGVESNRENKMDEVDVAAEAVSNKDETSTPATKVEDRDATGKTTRIDEAGKRKRTEWHNRRR